MCKKMGYSLYQHKLLPALPPAPQVLAMTPEAMSAVTAYTLVVSWG